MQYLSQEELNSILTERDLFDLTDNKDATEQAALLLAVNEDAVGLIHGYLRGRYVLPVASPDLFFKGIVKDVMKYMLYKRRDALNVPDTLLKLHAQTLALLKDIQRGVIVLDADKVETTSGNNGGNQILFGDRTTFKTNIF
ncbi:MAG: DUF1320 family protein [Chitinophagales bacterium]|nr:DUF1320 family protein [Chitinophagales bacterium]